MWNERFAGPEYVYGKEPNDFLKSVVGRLPKGRALCLGEGEGRNAVFLAQQGFEVTAVDSSDVGLAKAQKLAAERGVTLTTVVADLADYVIAPGTWSVVVSIWCHLPPALRAKVHAAAVQGLVAGGAFVLEAYTPRQLAHGTGGPKQVELLMPLEALRRELAGLELVHAVELEREVREGALHQGLSAVVQVLALKR